jgi:hypothetical protein
MTELKPWEAAIAETNRLRRELDITNADHIALWIEANTVLDEPMNQCASWLAVQIVEAYERTRATPRTDEELVERLRYTYEHGIFVAAENGMLAGADEAADCITALSAEVERLKADGRLLINDCDCIGMKSPMLENFRQALGAKP